MCWMSSVHVYATDDLGVVAFDGADEMEMSKLSASARSHPALAGVRGLVGVEKRAAAAMVGEKSGAAGDAASDAADRAAGVCIAEWTAVAGDSGWCRWRCSGAGDVGADGEARQSDAALISAFQVHCCSAARCAELQCTGAPSTSTAVRRWLCASVGSVSARV